MNERNSKKRETGSPWYASKLGMMVSFISILISVCLLCASLSLCFHSVYYSYEVDGLFQGIETKGDSQKMLLRVGDSDRSYLMKDPVEIPDYCDMKGCYVSCVIYGDVSRSGNSLGEKVVEIRDAKGRRLPLSNPYYYSYMRNCTILYVVTVPFLIFTIFYSFRYFSNAVSFCENLIDKRNRFFKRKNGRIQGNLRTYQEIQGSGVGWHYGIYKKSYDVDTELFLSFVFEDVHMEKKWSGCFYLESAKLVRAGEETSITDLLLERIALSKTSFFDLEDLTEASLYMDSLLDALDKMSLKEIMDS